ncbi:glycosyl hydrolase family 61-domain-containing protein [Dactylonectria estremocensis]|uniref:lytic cellulose monooxygenase (C4-dehydrogenating) n=1 Tax=Dactylonectria estremocensis TaxID=1079267 RepID=A0A9P9ELL2_9HYPO|nr:glycosyl hydrolase family 61-domain-containing protein [Dactylonectria estremocensis]
MKSTYIASAVLGLVSSARAHYTFDQLTVNDVLEGSANTYIRQHQNGYMPTKFINVPDGSITPLDADFTCNKGAVASSDVYTVKAGDKIGLKQAYGGTGMLHPGPTQVYISAADDATTYDGSGDWYKVHQSLICTAGNAESLRSTAWCSYGEDRVWFTVPSTIPNGQYLVRGEHIALHGAHGGEAEFYYACAQIEVTGNTATSIPGTAVSIPGVYQSTDAAVNFSLWGSSTSYDVIPGPDVIPGGTIRGSADGASGDVSETVSGGSSSGSDDSTPAVPASTTTSVTLHAVGDVVITEAINAVEEGGVSGNRPRMEYLHRGSK